MTVPGGCHSEDCDGYLACSLLTHSVCPGTIPQPSIGHGFGRSTKTNKNEYKNEQNLWITIMCGA